MQLIEGLEIEQRGGAQVAVRFLTGARARPRPARRPSQRLRPALVGWLAACPLGKLPAEPRAVLHAAPPHPQSCPSSR